MSKEKRSYWGDNELIYRVLACKTIEKYGLITVYDSAQMNHQI